MIGAILSLHYVGKKNWIQSIVFWITYIIAGAIITAIIPATGVLSLILAALIFMSIAHYWYKFNWQISFKLFAIAFFIDIILTLVLVAILFGLIGLEWTELFPTTQFVNSYVI